MTVQWKTVKNSGDLAAQLELNLFKMKRNLFTSFMLSVSGACCGASANPLKLLYCKVHQT